jgi:hypothetical protein
MNIPFQRNCFGVINFCVVNNTHLDNTNISLLLKNAYECIQVSIFHEHDLYVVHLFIHEKRHTACTVSIMESSIHFLVVLVQEICTDYLRALRVSSGLLTDEVL